jgi:hypothetical protein
MGYESLENHARGEEHTHMTDPPRYPDSNSETGDDTRMRPDRGSTTSTPRWVKVFGIIVGVVVVLFVILLFTRGSGGHGPGMHGGGDTLLASITEDSGQQP